MKRDKKVDLIKGLGIVCMVAGHCGVAFTDFIYLFHMAIFFMVSGYCYKKENSANVLTVFKYVKNKFKTLWFPYVLWTVIFTLCHNLFLKLNIYTNNPDVFNYLPTESVSLKAYLSVKDIVKGIINAFVLRGRTEMGGAFWFIITLFEISIIYCCIGYFIKKVLKNRHFELLQTIVAIVFLVGGYFCSIKGITTFGIDRILTCYSLFHLGLLLKSYGVMLKIQKNVIHILLGLGSFGVLLVMNQFGKISLGDNSYVNPIFMLIASIAGWFMLYELAYLIEKLNVVEKVITCLGQNTLAVVILHFLCFKLVSLVGVLIQGQPIYLIAAFPILYEGIIWCIAYLLCGLGVPVALSMGWKKIFKN